MHSPLPAQFVVQLLRAAPGQLAGIPDSQIPEIAGNALTHSGDTMQAAQNGFLITVHHLEFFEQVYHFNSCYRRINALVASLGSSPFNCLLYSIGGDHSVYYRNS